MSLCNGQCEASQPADCSCGQKLKHCDFLGPCKFDKYVRFWMMVVLIELYPFIPLSVTLIAFQGPSGVNSN